jgi:NitT/TauT family transport system substrate-binding protein
MTRQYNFSSLLKYIVGMGLVSICLILSTGPTLAQELPKLTLGYIFTTHHTPLIVAMAKEDAFKPEGVYFKTIVAKERYELIVKDRPQALIDIMVNKSGSETITMFAQKRLDVALASVTAMMAGVDKGTPIKTLCPTHVEGMGLVYPVKSQVKGWEAVLKSIKEAKAPVKIGYHSPDSAPRIVIEGALRAAGLKVTSDPMDTEAQVLLVDLKTTANLIPALLGGQVDSWVGPAPFPEMAEVRKAGTIALDLRDLPPTGKWHNFPCCVLGARQETVDQHADILKNLISLLRISSEWANANKDEVAQITLDWMGTPTEAVARSSIVYTTVPSENWFKGVDLYLDILNEMDKFNGPLKDKKLEQVHSLLFDLRFVSNP